MFPLASHRGQIAPVIKDAVRIVDPHAERNALMETPARPATTGMIVRLRAYSGPRSDDAQPKSARSL